MYNKTSRISVFIGFVALAMSATMLLAQSQPNAANGRQLGIILFDVTPDRLSPSTMTVVQGWYVIRVRNGISLSQLAVQLDHESLGAVMSANIKAGASAAQQVVELHPGKHTLMVGGRAKWTATLVVTAN